MGKRIGIMGGTFDPIHIGHLLIAEAAADQLCLDTVLFMPAARPPHKEDNPDRASGEDRVKMVELAIEGNDRFRLSLYEMQHQGKSFSYKTLEALRNVNPENELFFIMGADSLFTFDTWVEPGKIAKAASLAACIRDHCTKDQLEEAAQSLKDRFGARVYLVDSPNIDISSTDIRKWLKAGRSVKYFVPDRVIDHIRSAGLYTTDET